jgi:uncharacterized protein (TIGR01777 family)
MQSLPTKRILLTGGTGFLGQALGQELVLRGYTVTVISRTKKEALANLSFPADVVTWEDEEAISEALSGAEAVIHLAGDNIGRLRWTRRSKASILASRVKTTARLTDWINRLENPPKAFLVASAIGIYGHRGQEELTEDSAAGQGFLAETAIDWEAASEKLPSETRRVIMRFGVILGLAGGMLRKIQPIYASNLGSRLGDGKQILSWIHLDDAVAAIGFLLENPSLSGPFHICAPNPTPHFKLHDWLNKRFASLNPPPVPAWVLKVLMGEASSILFDSIRALPKRLLAAGFHFRYPHLEQALSQLYRDCSAKMPLLLTQQQWISADQTKVWSFFSRPENLESITPPNLGFKILSQSEGELQQGSKIRYRIKLRGIPLKWETVLTVWRPRTAFTDVQMSGPYKTWIHAHEFVALGKGFLLKDLVQYELPMPFFSHPLFGWLITMEINRIFRYRHKAIARLVGRSR